MESAKRIFNEGSAEKMTNSQFMSGLNEVLKKESGSTVESMDEFVKIERDRRFETCKNNINRHLAGLLMLSCSTSPMHGNERFPHQVFYECGRVEDLNSTAFNDAVCTIISFNVLYVLCMVCV